MYALKLNLNAISGGAKVEVISIKVYTIPGQNIDETSDADTPQCSNDKIIIICSFIPIDRPPYMYW